MYPSIWACASQCECMGVCKWVDVGEVSKSWSKAPSFLQHLPLTKDGVLLVIHRFVLVASVTQQRSTFTSPDNNI